MWELVDWKKKDKKETGAYWHEYIYRETVNRGAAYQSRAANDPPLTRDENSSGLA